MNVILYVKNVNKKKITVHPANRDYIEIENYLVSVFKATMIKKEIRLIVKNAIIHVNNVQIIIIAPNVIYKNIEY